MVETSRLESGHTLTGIGGSNPPLSARTSGKLLRVDRSLATSMRVFINGDEKTFERPLSLAELIQLLGMKGDRVAVELNREIVARANWAETRLNDGDRLEVVHFVGGG